MKKLLTLVVFVVCAHVALAQETVAEIIVPTLKKIDKNKPANWAKTITSITKQEAPDSTIIVNGMVTMFFHKLNIQATIGEDTYKSYMTPPLTASTKKKVEDK